jgi:UDP-N-acetylmuramate--alanine ligase
MDIGSLKKIHMIGIGGVGVSAIAEILHENGVIVTGSDLKESDITKKLIAKGIKVFYGHIQDNLSIDTELLVYTSAINNENPEYLRALELDIPTLSRSQILGLLMKDYINSIAIAGTHGKSTTTSLTSVIIDRTDKKPTILIGADVKELNGNAKVGHKDILITEACEYRENFLDFNFNIGVILNIDEDHLDYFKDMNHIISTFEKFAQKIPKTGYLIINGDDLNSKRVINHSYCNVITFGIDTNSNVIAKNIEYNEFGYPSFDIFENDTFVFRATLSIVGTHNIYNALAAYCISKVVGVEVSIIKDSFLSFTGAKRRYELKGYFNGAPVIDDYAHHPTEIRATLDAVTRIKNKKVALVFQPHTYTRTKELLNEFAESFNNVDKLYIIDIYASREKDTGIIHSKDLIKLIKEKSVDVVYKESFEKVIEDIQTFLNEEWLFITMGAGNVNEIGEALINSKK